MSQHDPNAPTLRDTFAAQILPAMLIAPKEPGVPRMKMDQMAVAAYAYADALIRARTLPVPVAD